MKPESVPTPAERAIQRVGELNHLVRRLNQFGAATGLNRKAGNERKTPLRLTSPIVRPYDVGDDAM